MDEQEPVKGEGDAIRAVGTLGEAEGLVGFLHEELRPLLADILREELKPIIERLDRIEATQTEHGQKLAKLNEKIDAVDNRLSDLRRDLEANGMLPPAEAV